MVVGVLLALAVLLISLTDGFLSIHIDIFSSPLPLIVMLVGFWFIAPWIVKFLKMKSKS
jgi:hypothetical protein